MKKLFLITLYLVVTHLFHSCRQEEVPAPDFRVSTAKDTYQVGEEITFNFEGNAKNIVFWSGETGRQYTNRMRTNEKGIALLKFISTAEAGGHADNLRVMISSDFNEHYDASGISSANWTDITALDGTPASENLALGHTYKSSSDINATQTAPKAFDESMATVWQAIGTANQWLSIDFGSAVSFNQVILKEVAKRATAYRIEYGDDGNKWVTAVNGTGVGPINNMVFPTVTARYFRIFYVSGSSNANLGELEIYHNPALEKKALLSTLNGVGVVGANTPSTVDISEFVEGNPSKLFIAFKYRAANDALKPRAWGINQFSITNTLSDGTVNAVVPSLALAGFKFVDVANPNYIWGLAPNLTNPVLLSIPSGNPGEAENEDWAISAPIDLTRVAVADAGVPVSSISTLNAPSFFKYVFTAPGTYKVIFHAFNQNLHDKKELLHEMVLTIMP